ncbi:MULTISPECIES: hypothetical protein [Vibrio]|uniref:Uncharacterized protein n=1 Tax=Vibrio tasmaniensis TaxID=212663 RepID=A0A2N7NCN8_9VIBR|nr:hypothetical protein [Vibrio tasmaniensis]PMO89864.1 hypothetical protein BCT01_00865 [Vibrio tasmaniensis]PMP09964.1 hypothetical protein BCS92_02225 [Vibrio tasmaniensis]TKG27969.1 hypothetical protein FC057_22540 [Vibrio tasmaniensis]TKG40546.1 hypothetical protein FC060_23845 [Vibrio tasmaniensis]TKG41666.1 hypothetical protein FC063_07330 [Vibrio tasmaniensis]
MRIDLGQGSARMVNSVEQIPKMNAVFGEFMLEQINGDKFTVNEDNVAGHQEYDDFLLEVPGELRVHLIDDLSRFRINRSLSQYMVIALEVPQLEILKSISEVTDFNVTIINESIYLRLFLFSQFFTFKVSVTSDDCSAMSDYFKALRSRKPVALTVIQSEVHTSYTDIARMVAEEVATGDVHRCDISQNPKAYVQKDRFLINASPL